MADTITSLDVLDVRLDTSSTLVGSDAMNPIPDYSAAYLILRTSGEHDGHALVFTIGEGTELQVAAIRALEPLVKGLAADLGPYWAEEPTSPDDVLGHARIRREVAPVKVATGEHAHSRVMFKQLLQAGGLDVVNLDACRVAGINENVAILLLAARFGAAVCPHAGGVGLCEMVQHLAMLDNVAVSGTLEGRVLEYADHLHEHFRSRW